jgi:hypothetical protein
MMANLTLTPETLAGQQNLERVAISVAELWRNLMLLLYEWMSHWQNKKNTFAHFGLGLLSVIQDYVSAKNIVHEFVQPGRTNAVRTSSFLSSRFDFFVVSLTGDRCGAGSATPI